MGVNGAIITTMITYLAKIAVQLYFGKDRLRGKFNIVTLRIWLKLSWMPLYSNLGHVASVIDVIAYSIIIRSVIGVSYYSVSNSITSMIAQAGLISQALYPKLLANRNFEQIKDNFSRLMYFAIPLLGISIIFSKPALFALNPTYTEASTLVILLAFRTFFCVITTTLYQILLGIETVDIEKNVRASDFAKSKLFLIPTLSNIQYVSYIGILALTLFVLNSQHAQEIILATWWAVISLVTQIPFLIYAWFVVQKNIKFSIDIRDILKYVSVTIGFSLVFMVTSSSIIKYKISIYDFMPGLILELAVCIGIYLFVTYAIDKKTRILFKSILTELTSK